MAGSLTAADKPTKVEIGKRGKAATAFVDVPEHGTGTAFCVHPSGLFVTNEHVIRGAEKSDILLVLNPTLPGEQILKARVVRTDKAQDLALLRVVGAKELPSLPLGSIVDVAELAEVVAVGFPLGRALSPDRKEYPAVSVNAGSVTALRQKAGELHRIQIDVALTFGNSGGPVLDDTGKVIGVVVSGIPLGKGINQAIPVSQLERFLKAPDSQFTPPDLTTATVGKLAEFKARATVLVPGAPEPTLKLQLQTGDEAPREFPMTKKDGVWTATALPSANAAEARVEITAKLTSGTITALVADSPIKVAGKVLRLSEVRKIDLGAKPTVLLADGRTALVGAITGLGTVEIALGDQTVKLDLGKASQITVQAAPAVLSVTATIIASFEGKELARTDLKLSVRDASSLAPADPSSVVISPPALAEDKVVKKLPEAYTDVVLGGGGRYLIFHLPKLKKLAIFDVNEARITNYIPVTEDKIAFAAGLDCVVIGLPKANRLERWSLTTFEREKSVPPPFKMDIGTVLMGHGSNGPVVVNGFFLDPTTFRQMGITDDKGNDCPLGGGVRIPSADGTVFTAWNTHFSPDSQTSFVLEGSIVRRYEEGGLMHVVPGPDGKSVYSSKGVVSATLKRSDPDDATYGYCLPAVRGDYFLSLTAASGGKGGGFTVYLRGLKSPLAKLDKADHGISFDGWDRGAGGPWQRVFFVPDAKVIVVLPDSNDQLVLHKFDAEAALVKSGLDYLIVTSRPPTTVKAGATLRYPITVKAKSAKVEFKLDSGPKGMLVSAIGEVTWAVPADAPAGEQDVILTVKDGTGQELFHTFTLRVVKP